ncbi:MAG: phosphatidylserine decarboxylase, partial [Chloroflexi bacterium]|nr:phosphatidylserine decarboxylase [Chloroflexota bacterium]
DWFVARRIVSFPKVVYFIKRGDRIGIIKFGSRVELYLPKEVDLLVRVGDRVKAGETVLGVIVGDEGKDEGEEGKMA